jgi:hypothetical protein
VKRFVVKYVEQEHDYGCAVACIAMISGEAYADVERCFKEDFSKQALKHESVRDYLCDRNFAAIEKTAPGYADVRIANARMAVPFAPVHLVNVLPYVNAKHGHSVVMDGKGRVYDPQHPEVKDFSDYYCIFRVTGYFYEGAEVKKKR